MQQIFRGKAFALYAQVALFDAEDKGSYPQWEVGAEGAVVGPKGVAVATAQDADIEVLVYEGAGDPGGRFCISGKIEVGTEGLLVGNVVADDVAHLEWPSGRACVSVYVNEVPYATRVMFVLESAGR